MSYLPVLDRLTPSIRTIAVSQRGHGDSDKPAAGYRVEDFASDAVHLLDALGIERAMEQFAEEVMKVPARVWREMFAALIQYDDLPELGRITARTLLIWGDADGLVGRGMQEQLAAALPCEDLVVYAGVGHTPRWEDPSRFAADVDAFVSGLFL